MKFCLHICLFDQGFVTRFSDVNSILSQKLQEILPYFAKHAMHHFQFVVKNLSTFSKTLVPFALIVESLYGTTDPIRLEK